MRTYSADPAEAGSLESPAALLAGYVLWMGGVLLLVVSVWLTIRRFQGAISQPPGIGFPLMAGAMLAGVFAAVGALAERTPRWSPVPPACVTLSGILLGAAFWGPDACPAGSGMLWLLVAGGAVWSWSRRRIAWRGSPPCAREEMGKTAAESHHQESCDEEEEGLLPAEVTQRMIRARDEWGSEVIYGTLRCHFAAGQRLQSAHLAFCPPLAEVAQFTVDQLVGPSARIKTSMLETFGAGLELKLAASSKEATDVQIQFFAFERLPDGGG